jgi:hypothetical protein
MPNRHVKPSTTNMHRSSALVAIMAIPRIEQLCDSCDAARHPSTAHEPSRARHVVVIKGDEDVQS